MASRGFRLASCISVVALGVLVAPRSSASEDAPKGKLVIVGGGSTTSEIVRRTLEIAGGAKARVVVVPQASALPDAGKASVEMWREAGAARADALDLTNAEAAAKLVASADIIWMPGGDQNRLVAALEPTPIDDAIRQRFRDGAVVGGTSAGAAAMSLRMMTGNGELDSVKAGGTELTAGLGLWPGVIVDQHFGPRGRFNRLLSAILDHPDLVGVGIDPSTAVIVQGSTFEVIGEGNVMVVDARKAKVRRPEASGPIAASAIAIHLLRRGMRYDLDKGPVD
ncbi:MAG: cyanophycinase [Planctomycetes bacterium]|nr:cyanophycinase [Planctomycetota bacterium]MBI3846404.1 cyanophycinase [Planctomycetota bacterium]